MPARLPGPLALAALAFAVLLAVLLRLGFWQLERASLKDARSAGFAENASAVPVSPASVVATGDPERWRFRRVRVAGRLDGEHQYLIDNRTHAGRAGYHVLTPLLASDGTVLVNRGWVPTGSHRDRLPDVTVGPADAPVTGLLVPPGDGPLLLGESGYANPGWPKVVQDLEPRRIAQQLGVDLIPAVVLLDPSHPACYVCEWKPVQGMSADRHRGYATQWFALAATLVVIVAVLLLRTVRRGR